MSEAFRPLDPDAQLGYLLVRVADRVAKEWSSALKAHRINPRQFSVLALVVRDPSMSQAELARRVMVTPQSMSESLSALLDAGLIARVEEGQGLASRHELTPAGERLLRKANPVVERSNQDAFAALTAPERRELGRLLAKLLR